VKDSSFVRDVNSMGLSNLDKSAKSEYESKLNMVKLQKQELNIVKDEIESIRNEFSEIKDLLKKLLEK
jgi:hypothetical protein